MFASLVLHVERECSHVEGHDTSISNARRLNLPRDAARAFWQLFEALRYTRFQGDRSAAADPFVGASVAGYPVDPAEEIQDNPLARTCDTIWVYEGVELPSSPLGGIPTISITKYSWTETVSRLAKGEPVPPYVSFGLDAAYFSKGDPIRGVIMACTAWETALRYYLANVASKPDPAYLIAANVGNIPRLYSFVKVAKGGPLFHDAATDPGLSQFIDRQRECIQRLPEWRNKLVHEGKTAIPDGAATDAAFAVLNAIDWLFR